MAPNVYQVFKRFSPPDQGKLYTCYCGPGHSPVWRKYDMIRLETDTYASFHQGVRYSTGFGFSY